MRRSRINKIRFGLPMLTALLLAAFLIVGVAMAANWSTQVVHTHTQNGADLNEYGQDTSLDFDAANNPHISYYYEFDDDHGPRGLKHATLDNAGNWQVEAVDMVGETGRDSSISADGTVSISYYDENNKDLKFAQRLNGSWVKEVADNGGGASKSSNTDVGEDTSLKMDINGKAHISYYNDSSDDLKYAVFVGNGNGNCGGPNLRWQCTTVDSSGKVGKYTSLALDSTGKAHISYYDDTHGNLKYASEVTSGGNCGSGKWNCVTVDASTHDVGEHTSLALLNDKPQIAYEDDTVGSLMYVCQGPDGVWSAPQLIANDGHDGEDSSLAIGSDGLPQISYHNETNETLNFAKRTDICGVPGTWQTEVIDNGGPHHHQVGEDNSLALKSDDTPCVSYHDESSGDLKYSCAVATPPPTVTNVQPAGVINTSSATISADYIDNSGTGIDIGSVKVYLDGNLLTGCAADGAHVTCQVNGLTDGGHAIVVNVKDNNGNSGTGAGAFTVNTCALGKPDLRLVCPDYPNHVAYWTYTDFVAGILSVDWTIGNTGATTAYGVQLTGSASTYLPITTITSMSLAYGDIAPGASVTHTVQYQLPDGFAGTGFHVVNTASANDCSGMGYTYPN